MAERDTQKSRVWLWMGTGVVLVAVFFSARYWLRGKLTVRIAQATQGVLVNTVSTNGHIEPVANYAFYSPLATTVKAVYVQPGDKVPAGKLLMQLDDVEARAQVARAESGVKSAQAALDAITHNGTQEQRQASAAELARGRLQVTQAEHNLAALEKLAASGAASASEVSTAKMRLQAAQMAVQATQQTAGNRYSPDEVNQARATLAEAEANLQAAREVLNKTQIRAPIAGTVYNLNVAATEFAEAGKQLLELADLQHERVRAYFDEPDIGRIRVGETALIKWDAMPGREWHGHVVRTPITVATYGTRTVGDVLIAFDDNSDGLLPDTNVTVTVTIESEPNALSVPREALHSEDAQFYVYKVVGDELVRTPVTTGIINLTQVAILSGLHPGDWVATGTLNGQPLQEGMPIKAVR